MEENGTHKTAAQHRTHRHRPHFHWNLWLSGMDARGGQSTPTTIHGNGRCEPTPSRAKRAQAVASVSLIHSRRGGPGAGFPREAPRGAPDRCLTTGIPVGRDCADSRQGMAARDSRHQDHHHSTTEGAVAAIKNSPGSCPQPRPPGTTTTPPRATTPRGGRASRNGSLTTLLHLARSRTCSPLLSTRVHDIVSTYR